MHNKNIGVEFLVSDDDSTMRAHLQHVGTIKNGKLPLEVHQPKFLCDPSHRIKVMVKDIFGLATMSNAKSEFEKIDALRIKNTSDVGLVRASSYLLMNLKLWEMRRLSTCSGVMSGVALLGVMPRR